MKFEKRVIFKHLWLAALKQKYFFSNVMLIRFFSDVFFCHFFCNFYSIFPFAFRSIINCDKVHGFRCSSLAFFNVIIASIFAYLICLLQASAMSEMHFKFNPGGKTFNRKGSQLNIVRRNNPSDNQMVNLDQVSQIFFLLRVGNCHWFP